MASNQIRSIRTHEACPSRRRKRKLHAQPILTEPKVQPMRFHSVIDPKLMVTSHSTPEMPTVNCTKSSQVPPTKSPPPPIRVSRKADGSESNGKVKKVGRRGGTRSRQGLSKKKGLTSDLLSTESTFPDAHVAQVDWPKPLPMQGIIIEPDPSYARENLQVPKPLRLLNLIVPQRNSSAVAERNMHRTKIHEDAYSDRGEIVWKTRVLFCIKQYKRMLRNKLQSLKTPSPSVPEAAATISTGMKLAKAPQP